MNVEVPLSLCILFFVIRLGDRALGIGHSPCFDDSSPDLADSIRSLGLRLVHIIAKPFLPHLIPCARRILLALRPSGNE